MKDNNLNSKQPDTRDLKPPLLTASKPELLADGSDQVFRQMIHDLLAFASRLEAVRARFGDFVGLTGIQYTLLISIRDHSETKDVGIKAIAKHLSLSGAFVTIETNKLVKLGLLDKVENSTDRRRVLLTLTARGRSLLSELAPVQQKVNDALFDSLDSQTFLQLAALSSQLKADADKALLLANYLFEGT